MSKTNAKRQKWEKVESKLQVADIILAREKKYYSKIIQKGTDSYWSHTLLVFFVPDKKMLFKNTLVIGAQSRGIEIHRIQKFTENYDIGVKRVSGLSAETKERVLSFMFNNIDIPYDYTRLFALFLNYFINILRGGGKREHLKKFLINKDAFICSGFIQKAFFEAMPKGKKDSVLFTEDKDAKLFMEEITPADIAQSKNCEWIYNPHK